MDTDLQSETWDLDIEIIFLKVPYHSHHNMKDSSAASVSTYTTNRYSYRWLRHADTMKAISSLDTALQQHWRSHRLWKDFYFWNNQSWDPVSRVYINLKLFSDSQRIRYFSILTQWRRRIEQSSWNCWWSHHRPEELPFVFLTMRSSHSLGERIVSSTCIVFGVVRTRDFETRKTTYADTFRRFIVNVSTHANSRQVWEVISLHGSKHISVCAVLWRT